MKSLLNDVADFHRVTDGPIRVTPQGYPNPGFPDPARVKLRGDLLDEEVREYHEAVGARDIVEVADALGDIIYIAVGTALEFGIPLDAVWAAIHRSNMAKVDPETGKVLRREDGKILKPTGWTPPNIIAALIPPTLEDLHKD